MSYEASRVASQLSRARVAGLPATLTIEEWTRTIADFAGLCAYCEESPVEVLEHFVALSQGGGTTAGNCLPACRSCNQAKGRAGTIWIANRHGADRLSTLREYLAARSTGRDVGPKPGRLRFVLHVPADLLKKAREIADASPERPEFRPAVSVVLVEALRRGLASKALARE